MQAFLFFFFFSCVLAKKAIRVSGVPETVETGDKYLGVMKATHGRIMRKMQNFSGTGRFANSIDCKTIRIFAFSSTREQSNKRSLLILLRKKPTVLQSKNSIVWKRWLLWNKWILQWLKKRGIFNGDFYCMQMSLVMSRRFIFGDDWNDAPCWSRFAENDLKRLFYRRYKKGMKTQSKVILFRVVSHVVANAKSSKASEFKFPWIEESMFYGRFSLLDEYW